MASEHSLGGLPRRGRGHQDRQQSRRRLPVEAALHHRKPYRPTAVLRRPLGPGLPAAVAQAPASNHRVHRRWVSYAEHKKRPVHRQRRARPRAGWMVLVHGSASGLGNGTAVTPTPRPGRLNGERDRAVRGWGVPDPGVGPRRCCRCSPGLPERRIHDNGRHGPRIPLTGRVFKACRWVAIACEAPAPLRAARPRISPNGCAAQRHSTPLGAWMPRRRARADGIHQLGAAAPEADPYAV